jgi:hypothetical protein
MKIFLMVQKILIYENLPMIEKTPISKNVPMVQKNQ